LFHRAPDDDARPAREVRTREVDAGPSDPDCTVRTLRAGEKFAPVDMVWVVDSSRSMGDERDRIERTMNQFVSDAEARNFDVRLTMVTSTNIVPPPLGSDDARYRFVEREVSSHEPLTALLEEFPRYQDFLRADAALHFVIVTDDDSEISAGDFRRQMDRLVGRPYVVHAVASPDVDGQPCRTENATEQCRGSGWRAGATCGAAAVGRQYLELAEELGGEDISICLNDWGEVFGPLLEAVTPTEIPCAIVLAPDAELDATGVRLRVSSAQRQLAQVAGLRSCAARPDAYFYIETADGPQLTLCPAACQATRADGVELDIASHCE
jgi:hypothetical protein